MDLQQTIGKNKGGNIMKKEDLKAIKGGKKEMEDKEYKSNVLMKLNDILDTYLTELKDARSPQLRADALVLIKELILNLNIFMEYKYKVIALKKEIKQFDLGRE